MGMPVVNSTLKELLPHSLSGTIDGSALLSASDLITLLEKIRTRSEGIKEKVHKTVTTYNKEFKRIISQANSTAADVRNVSDELEAVLELFGDSVGYYSPDDRQSQKFLLNENRSSDKINGSSPEKNEEVRKDNDSESSENVPVDIEICNLAGKIHAVQSRIKEREEALVVVNAMSSLFQQLLSTEKMFLPTRLEEAAENMRSMQRKLGAEPSYEQQAQGELGNVKAFKLLQDAWRQRFEKLIGILEDLFARAIVFNESRSELLVLSPVTCENLGAGDEPDAIELSAIFKAMDVMGVLDARLAKLGDSIHKHVLSPILRNPSIMVSTADHITSNLSSRSSLTLLKSGAQVNKGQRDEPVFLLYPKIAQVIAFLHKHIFGDHREWMTRFGRLFWPRLAEAIISGCLSKAVPSETSQLKEFHKIADLTKNFEVELASEGLIPRFDRIRGDKLSNFASDVEVHFANKKKKYLLAQARDVLMQADYSLSESSWGRSNSHLREGSDSSEDRSVFLLQNSCAISYVARRLLTIVHEAIEEACLATPRTALELYHAARDIILLYRAIIPVKLGLKMNSLSQVAALCHNDCLYIAHELLTFPYQYGNVLAPGLKEVFTFVDLVPIFRRLAEDFLDRQTTFVDGEIMMKGMIIRLRQIIIRRRRMIHLGDRMLCAAKMKTIDQCRGFQQTDDQQQYEITRQSLQKVLAIFDNLATLWRPVLSLSMYKKVMSGLIDSVVSRIVFEVLAIDDISVQETVQLQELLRFVQESFPPLLAPAAADESSRDQEREETYEPFEKLAPSWRKLEGLLNLLDMSLVSITQAWESGDLTSRGFSAAEVQEFIRAIFSDTALREECLQRIVPRFGPI